MKITFLGTGTSHGVPSLDCMLADYAHCKKGVCRASLTDPKHRRSRCSILAEHQGLHILFDVSADFRQQALENRIPKVDAVFITHRHADNIGGLPDIRSYTKYMQNALPIYASAETLESVRISFDYIFNPSTFVGGGIPVLTLNEIKPLEPLRMFQTVIVGFPVGHGNLSGCFGYRFGDMAYIPDVKSIGPESLKQLQGLQVLIVNCLRDEREASTHLILPESMELSRKLAPGRTYFIHMCHDIHYEIDGEKLDPSMAFAYDGLTIQI
ncbi:MAG: MBL fold metallo-hydrolase [Chitinivibrionales bacterium]|nr:MBL fold metallo-hydrolase [Chitinivibrionales bacterium]